MIDQTLTVGQLVAEDYRRGAAFRQFGIDFCCGGGKPLLEACARKGVDVNAVIEALEQSDARQTTETSLRYHSWAPDFLAQYIVQEHHSYVRESLPTLVAFASKVASVHGESYPVHEAIRDLVLSLRNEMVLHMAKEEEDTFPLLQKLSDLEESVVQELFLSLEEDHEHAGATMAQIRDLTRNYTPPLSACATWRALWAKLDEFERDLHLHVHLENNILFPKIRKNFTV